MSQPPPKVDIESIFGAILKSMDIEPYGPEVITAIDAYARRFATDLLCDAKDYATYAGRNEINADDIQLALRLTDARVLGLDNRPAILAEQAAAVNSQDLVALLDKDAVFAKYPNTLQDSLQQRTYTFVPGADAYPEVHDLTHAMQPPVAMNVKTASHVENVVFKLTSEKRKPLSQTVDFDD